MTVCTHGLIMQCHGIIPTQLIPKQTHGKNIKTKSPNYTTHLLSQISFKTTTAIQINILPSRTTYHLVCGLFKTQQQLIKQ